MCRHIEQMVFIQCGQLSLFPTLYSYTHQFAYKNQEGVGHQGHLI